MQKKCIVCHVEKELEQFPRQKGCLDGHVNQCRQCVNARHRAWAIRPEVKPRLDQARRRYRASENGRAKTEARESAYRKTPEWRARERARAAKKREQEPEKFRARYMIGSRVYRGKLERKPCQVCGATPAHAHHHDYQKPLYVEWLCALHHAHAHGRGVKA